MLIYIRFFKALRKHTNAPNISGNCDQDIAVEYL